MIHDFEKNKIVVKIIYNAIRFKLNEIKISKAINEEITKQCNFKSRDILYFSFNDFNNGCCELTWVKDWYIGDEAAEIIEECLMLMDINESSTFTICDNENNVLLTFELKLHRFERAPFITDLNEEEVEELSNHYRLQGNDFFKSDQVEKAMKNYSFSLKLLWLYHSFLYGSYEKSSIENSNIKEDITSLLLNISACQLKSNSFDFVIENCTTILKANRKCVKALYRRGKAYFKIGKLDEAYNDFKEALDVNPHDTNVIKDFTELKLLLAKYNEDISNKMKKMFS